MKDLLTYTGLSDKGIQAPPLPEDRMTEFKTSLDPITFEVLRNAFVNIVDQMAEQLLRTCYSFVIYCRDFSSGLCDPEGNLVMQGTGDIAAMSVPCTTPAKPSSKNSAMISILATYLSSMTPFAAVATLTTHGSCVRCSTKVN